MKTSSTKQTLAMRGSETIKGLDAQGICSIIEKCDEHGVALLKYGNLEIWTGTKATMPPTPYPVGAPTTPGTKIDTEMSATKHAEDDARALRDNEAFLREQQLEELKITNPLAYEQMVRDEELADADNEPGDE